MNYRELSKEDFDAIITGELTHYALWFEDELHNIICDYFIESSSKVDDFKMLFLRRDGLTFQDTLEIVRGMMPIYGSIEPITKLNSLLKQIEDFKSWRNAFAHGRDVSEDPYEAKLKVTIVSRSGKSKIIEVTPESHEQRLEKAEKLLKELQEVREQLSDIS